MKYVYVPKTSQEFLVINILMNNGQLKSMAVNNDGTPINYEINNVDNKIDKVFVTEQTRNIPHVSEIPGLAKLVK